MAQCRHTARSGSGSGAKGQPKVSWSATKGEMRWRREFPSAESFSEDLGGLGASVDPPTGHSSPLQGQMEDYVLRRVLVALHRTNRLSPVPEPGVVSRIEGHTIAAENNLTALVVPARSYSGKLLTRCGMPPPLGISDLYRNGDLQAAWVDAVAGLAEGGGAGVGVQVVGGLSVEDVE